MEYLGTRKLAKYLRKIATTKRGRSQVFYENVAYMVFREAYDNRSNPREFNIGTAVAHISDHDINFDVYVKYNGAIYTEKAYFEFKKKISRDYLFVPKVLDEKYDKAASVLMNKDGKIYEFYIQTVLVYKGGDRHEFNKRRVRKSIPTAEFLGGISYAL